MEQREAEKLRSLVAQIDDLIASDVTSSSPEFKAWKTSVKRWLVRTYGAESIEFEEFNRTRFSLSIYTFSTPRYEWVIACREGLEQTKAVLQSYLEDDYSDDFSETCAAGPMGSLTKVFVVHGHDGELKSSVARLLERQGIEPIILMEQANLGATIIEKFERYSEVGAAICLFTKDDNATSDSDAEAKPRARQNVVFEAGYFIGKLGRERVSVIAEAGVEMPSDLNGILSIDREQWEVDLLKELKAMGFDIDMNRHFCS